MMFGLPRPKGLPFLPPHPTWEVIDSSKVTQFMECPRRFFWRYIVGWRPDAPNIHLTFGQAWHSAMDHLLRNGNRVECIDGAMEAFLKVWRARYTPEEDPVDTPKTPANAQCALSDYVRQYEHDDYELLNIEIPGEVLIADETPLVLRLDVLLRDPQGRIVVMDHKTASSFSTAWRESFNLSFQLGTYLHAAFSIFPEHEVYGAVINGACIRMPTRLRKDGQPYARDRGNEFLRIPILKTHDQMQVWHRTAIHWVSRIATDTLNLENASTQEEETLNVRGHELFPLNPTGCTKYGSSCPYMTFCQCFQNPLTLCERYQEEPPPGLIQSHWDPRENQQEESDGNSD